MIIQGMQFDVLQAIADRRQATSAEQIEDIEIAEETDLDIRLVRNALDALAEIGYINLEKIKTFSGMTYSAFLTRQGEAALSKAEV